MRSPVCFLPWLLALLLAPACAPDRPGRTVASTKKVIVLSDSSDWVTGDAVRQYLRTAVTRTLVSGDSTDTAVGLARRLPWLLQPGVDTFYYDHRLAGRAGLDSLTRILKRLEHPAAVITFTGPGPGWE